MMSILIAIFNPKEPGINTVQRHVKVIEEFKVIPKICKNLSLVSDLALRVMAQKVVVRHIWKDALDICEDIRHQSGMKDGITPEKR